MAAPRRRSGTPRPPDPPAAQRIAAPRGTPPRALVAPREPASPGVRVITASGFVDTAAGRFADRAAPPPPGMSRREFEQEYQRLLRAFAQEDENPGSISSTGCRQCVSCMFCKDCEECYRCTHCQGCQASSSLTHCVDCTGCHDCAYCVRSENCTRSSYLVLCRSCSECTYCLGCVGLAKKDFHILNVKYGKTEYFRIVKALEKELGVSR